MSTPPGTIEDWLVAGNATLEDWCGRCDHKEHADGGWCYMFLERPAGSQCHVWRDRKEIVSLTDWRTARGARKPE